MFGPSCHSLASDFTVARHLAGAIWAVYASLVSLIKLVVKSFSLVSLIVKSLSLISQTRVSHRVLIFPSVFLKYPLV